MNRQSDSFHRPYPPVPSSSRERTERSGERVPQTHTAHSPSRQCGRHLSRPPPTGRRTQRQT